jgi:hypothetical protein
MSADVFSTKKAGTEVCQKTHRRFIVYQESPGGYVNSQGDLYLGYQLSWPKMPKHLDMSRRSMPPTLENLDVWLNVELYDQCRGASGITFQSKRILIRKLTLKCICGPKNILAILSTSQ